MENLQKLLDMLNSSEMLKYKESIVQAVDFVKEDLVSVSSELNSQMQYAFDTHDYEGLDKLLQVQKQIVKCCEELDLLSEEMAVPDKPSFYDDNKEDSSPAPATTLGTKKEKAPNLTFSLLGIPVGAELTYVDDESIIVRVYRNDKVEFEGKLWTLSVLVRELKKRDGTVNRSGSYQGGKYFKYNGKVLTDIRKELEDGEKT